MERKIKIALVGLIATIFSFFFNVSVAYPTANKPGLIKIERSHRCYSGGYLCDLMEGFYLGASAGYDTYKIRQQASEGIDTSGMIGAGGTSGTLFGGYGRYFSAFYYAGELSVTGTSAGSSFNAISPTASMYINVNMRVSYVVSFLLGAKIIPSTLLYARLGAARSMLSVDDSSTTAGTSVTDHNTFWNDGVKYGVGLETVLLNPVSLRLEYTAATYGTESDNFGTRFTVSQGQWMLGLVYHFYEC